MGNAHSSIGPSAADRWISCPGSIALAAKAPAQRASYAAAEGSVAHQLAEQLVLGQVDEITLMGRVGEIVNHDGHEVTIIDEMVEGARLYRDVIEADRLAMVKMNRVATIHRHVELRVPIKDVDPECFGTLDCAQFQKGNWAIVYDYKFGQGHMVSPVKNRQAGLYYIGAEDEIMGKAFDKREIVIVQPRATGSESDRVKRWDVDVKWLADLRVEARGAIAQGRGPNPPIVAGPHCRWCPAQSFCPKIAEGVAQSVNVDFAMVPPTEAQVEAKELRGLPDIALMTPEKMRLALDWEDAIQAWFGALRAHVQGVLEAGQDFPGYKLVDGRSNRKWADETGEAAAAFFQAKIGHRVYAPRKVVSVAQMEKIVGKGGIPAEFIVKPPAAKKVARSDDPRPVARTTAMEDFGSVPHIQSATIPFDADKKNPAVVRDLSGLNRLLEEKGVAPSATAEATLDPLVDPLADPLADPLDAPAPKKREPVWP